MRNGICVFLGCLVVGMLIGYVMPAPAGVTTENDKVTIKHNTIVTTSVPADVQQSANTAITAVLNDTVQFPATVSTTADVPPVQQLPAQWTEIIPVTVYEPAFEDVWGGEFGDKEFVTSFIEGFNNTSPYTLSPAQEVRVRTDVLPRMKTVIHTLWQEELNNAEPGKFSAEEAMLTAITEVMQRHDYLKQIGVALISPGNVF